MISPPQSPGERLQVTNFDHCLHIEMVIGKSTDVFSFFFLAGEGGGVTWDDLSTGEFIMGEEKLHEGGAGFSSILKKNNEK